MKAKCAKCGGAGRMEVDPWLQVTGWVEGAWADTLEVTEPCPYCNPDAVKFRRDEVAAQEQDAA